MFVCFVYFRWYVWILSESLVDIDSLSETLYVLSRFVAVQGMYGFVREEFSSFSWQLKLLFSVYVILIKLIDLMAFAGFAHGVHKWLFTSAATKRPTKITKASLKRPTLIPIELIRTQSTPLMC